MKVNQSRRSLLRDWLALGIGMTGAPLLGEAFQKSPAKGKEEEPEVTATEDLMREHGVIRRALLVYIETVPKLRQKASSVDPNDCDRRRNFSERLARTTTKECWKSNTFFQ